MALCDRQGAGQGNRLVRTARQREARRTAEADGNAIFGATEPACPHLAQGVGQDTVGVVVDVGQPHRRQEAPVVFRADGQSGPF
ncbi:hypothetical protein RFD81_005044 [Klebsiella aerogenes]|nr:hypothetical protein [Klebsiella aerogenes]